MKRNYKKAGKGFTLIELLVVIAIIAVLSVVVILTLNPAELLRQSRDSNRISDLSVTKSAIAFYLASVSTNVNLSSSSVINGCFEGDLVGTSSANCRTFATSTSGGVVTSTSRLINSTGWIPIDFTQITAGGSPLSQLPVDPLFNPAQGNTTYFYAYAASSTGLVFKLDAHMESQKYGRGGSNDVVSTDGGYDPNSYEVGTDLLTL